jgi:phosphatidylglycerol:prolipoprotein diacylglycerol transferase
MANNPVRIHPLVYFQKPQVGGANNANEKSISPVQIIFPNGGGLAPRHASQLYEAFLEGVLLFFIMIFAFFYKNNYLPKNKPSFISGLFLIGYSLARFSIEFFRQPDEQIGFLWQFFTLGQILCLPTLILGGYLLFKNVSANYQTN